MIDHVVLSVRKLSDKSAWQWRLVVRHDNEFSVPEHRGIARSMSSAMFEAAQIIHKLQLEEQEEEVAD